MITIDESFIESAAPNADAAKNGRALVAKNKFLALHQTDDKTLYFGKCQGSGKEPYECSADFFAGSAPVYRCSCPSRQFPCKHSLGLLYAVALGKSFSIAEVPEDIAAKRAKVATKVEKKKQDADKPRTVDKGALAKKIKAQLAGIDLLEKLTLDLVRLGIGNMNVKAGHEIEEQAKQLGNAFLPGAQVALHDYTRLFRTSDGEELPESRREAIYSSALDQLGRLSALVKQGRAYLQRRLEDPELAPETETSIAAWLGHAWQLRELKDAGLVEAGAQLVQLAFNTHDDVARREYVDTGIWISLSDGRIHLTQTFRPYKATKFIKSDDSFFQVAQVPELCVYPGGVNRRVRWEAMEPRQLAPADLERIRSFGRADFAAAVKDVKNQLKGPLADKRPIYLLNFRQLARIGDTFVAVDAEGRHLAMTESGLSEEPPSCRLLPMLPPDVLTDQTLAARFHHDLDSNRLRIKPLSIITRQEIIRLTF